MRNHHTPPNAVNQSIYASLLSEGRKMAQESYEWSGGDIVYTIKAWRWEGDAEHIARIVGASLRVGTTIVDQHLRIRIATDMPEAGATSTLRVASFTGPLHLVRRALRCGHAEGRDGCVEVVQGQIERVNPQSRVAGEYFEDIERAANATRAGAIRRDSRR